MMSILPPEANTALSLLSLWQNTTGKILLIQDLDFEMKLLDWTWIWKT